MKKSIIGALIVLMVSVLSSCQTEQITCGEGTIIQDGKCVAPTKVDDQTKQPDDQTDLELSCDDLSGNVMYHPNFDTLQSNFVDNESNNPHNASNFVIWGQNDNGPILGDVVVNDNVLSLQNLTGTQLNHYYDSGLGYQYFQYETDTTYQVCVILKGPAGNTVTSELGIYYGHGTRDNVLLTGSEQKIIQDFKPTQSTNVDRGQYVLFVGNVTGELEIHEIKIVSID